MDLICELAMEGCKGGGGGGGGGRMLEPHRLLFVLLE